MLCNWMENCLPAIHANAHYAQTHSHTRTLSRTHTIDCCHFTLDAYVYESIIIYIDWWEWLFSIYWLFNWCIDTFVSHSFRLFFSFNSQTNENSICCIHTYIQSEWMLHIYLFIYFLNKQSFCRWNSLHMAGFIYKCVFFSRIYI